MAVENKLPKKAGISKAKSRNIDTGGSYQLKIKHRNWHLSAHARHLAWRPATSMAEGWRMASINNASGHRVPAWRKPVSAASGLLAWHQYQKRRRQRARQRRRQAAKMRQPEESHQ